MKRNGKISQSYNIQVTSSEGYILAADIAEANSENDLEQLAPTLSKAESNTGTSIRTASADSGYFHSSGLEYLDSKGINGFIPSPDQVAKERKGEEDSGYEAHQFKYDEDDDSWVWFNPLKLDSLFLILLDISPHIFEVSPILKLNVASSYYKDG